MHGHALFHDLFDLLVFGLVLHLGAGLHLGGRDRHLPGQQHLLAVHGMQLLLLGRKLREPARMHLE